jgi:hypothetical protein
MRLKPLPTIALAVTLAGAPALATTEFDVLSGAIGLDEREQMMKRYDDYNLHLAFARANGEFLADVNVTIEDARGETVFEGVSDGPLFFAALPRGNYRVTAEYDGRAITRSLNVHRQSAPMRYFHWR